MPILVQIQCAKGLRKIVCEDLTADPLCPHLVRLVRPLAPPAVLWEFGEGLYFTAESWSIPSKLVLNYGSGVFVESYPFTDDAHLCHKSAQKSMVQIQADGGGTVRLVCDGVGTNPILKDFVVLVGVYAFALPVEGGWFRLNAWSIPGSTLISRATGHLSPEFPLTLDMLCGETPETFVLAGSSPMMDIEMRAEPSAPEPEPSIPAPEPEPLIPAPEPEPSIPRRTPTSKRSSRPTPSTSTPQIPG